MTVRWPLWTEQLGFGSDSSYLFGILLDSSCVAQAPSFASFFQDGLLLCVLASALFVRFPSLKETERGFGRTENQILLFVENYTRLSWPSIYSTCLSRVATAR